LKLNETLKERGTGDCFDLNAQGGVQLWTALHLAAHHGYNGIVSDLIEAGADVFVRNTSGQIPRNCARGNYVMIKMLQTAEQKASSMHLSSYHLTNQFEIITGPKEADVRQDLTEFKTFASDLGKVKIGIVFRGIDQTKSENERKILRQLLAGTSTKTDAERPASQTTNCS